MAQYVPGYDDVLGVEILKIRGIFVDANWYWIGVGALIGYIILFNILFIFFLDWLDRKYQKARASAFKLVCVLTQQTPTALGKGQATISEETLIEKQANRSGASLEQLPSRVELLPSRSDSSKGAGQEGE